MTVCIYYEGDEVTPELFRRAADLLGGDVPPDAVHACAEDSAWTAEPVARMVSVPSHRSPEFRTQLWDAMDVFYAAARSNAKGLRGLVHGGVNVVDVARHEWRGSLAATAYRVATTSVLLDRVAPDTLVWIPEAERAAEEYAARLDLTLSTMSVRTVPAAKGPTAPAARHSRFRVVRRVISPVRAALAAARQLFGPSPVRVERSRRGGVLFVEHFSIGARLAARVAKSLDPSVPRWFVATRQESARAVADLGGVNVLASLVPRRARAVAAFRRALAVSAATRLCAVIVRDDASPWGDLTTLLEPELTSTGRSALGRAAAAITEVGAVVGRLAPRVVVSTTTTPAPVRAAALAARARGIPSVFVQHGLLLLLNFPAHLVHDRYLVWGDHDRRTLVRAGVASNNIVVTGSPAFEPLRTGGAATSRTDARWTVAYLPSRTGGRLVSVAQGRAMLDAVVRATRALPGTLLVVKIHPNDHAGLFDSIDAEGVQIVRSGDAHEIIEAADVVVVSTSTAGVEACALDRPVVALAFPAVDVLPEYEEYDAALVVSDEAELSSALRAVRDDAETRERLTRGRHRLVDEMFDGLPPDSVSRIVTAVLATRPG